MITISIYLDNAATTPICEAAKQAMMDALDNYGNPSSAYDIGIESRMLIEQSREDVARCINAEPDEIYFTSGGSESDTWALHNRYSISSYLEHHAINPTKKLRLNVYDDGIVYPTNLNGTVSLLKKIEPIELVSCMAVNNEIGSINPIEELADVSHEHGLLFHTDAVQAVGHIPIDVKAIKCDMLSASAHKFGGPKGVGFLYIKNGVHLDNLIYGGKQERGLRPSTENILGIVGMAAALKDSTDNIDARHDKIIQLRDMLLDELLSIPDSYLNGPKIQDARIHSNINIRFKGVSGQSLVSTSNLYGVCISSGSACNEGKATPSHVLTEIGLLPEQALESVRITLGHQNTVEEIEYAAKIIKGLVEKLRSM